jgi:hypothetical protein
LSRTSVHRTGGHGDTCTGSGDGSSFVTHSVIEVAAISDASTTSACATTIAVAPALRAAMAVSAPHHEVGPCLAVPLERVVHPTARHAVPRMDLVPRHSVGPVGQV